MDHAIQAIERSPDIGANATRNSSQHHAAKCEAAKSVTWKACGVAAGLRGYVIQI